MSDIPEIKPVVVMRECPGCGFIISQTEATYLNFDMDCPCGGHTEDKEKVEDKVVVVKYKVCTACKRSYVYWKAEKQKSLF